MKKFNPILFIACVLAPIAAGALSSFITGDAVESYNHLILPSFAVPSSVFPVAWTLLYIMIGIASYLVLQAGKPLTPWAIWLYAAQIAVNASWQPIFFLAKDYFAAFVWLILLFGTALATAIVFFRISKPAGALFIPYILWIAFAGALTFGVMQLN